MRESYRGQGFSARAANVLAAPFWLSTAQVYDRKWSIYCTRCAERQIDPIHISVGDLTDFFIYLFDRVVLAASTIPVYKAAILSAHEPRQTFSLVQLATLNKLLNRFYKRKPPKTSPIPDWDIGLVLKAVSLPSFEPLQQASVKVVTYKMLVLVALALGAHKVKLIALL